MVPTPNGTMILATVRAAPVGPPASSLVDEALRTVPLLHAVGVGIASDDLLALGGLAHRTYFFTPDDNHCWHESSPHPTWDDASLTIDNYGVWESLAGHTGASLRPYDGMTAAEQWQLIAHELEEGRLCRGQTADGRVWDLVGATHRKGQAFSVAPSTVAGTPPHEFEIPFAPGQGPPAPPFARVTVVRPDAPPAPPERAAMLLRDVLVFACRHAQTGKELDFTREVFVGSGARAWSLAAAFMGTCDASDVAAVAHGRVWLAATRRAREAAATSFRAARLPWDAVLPHPARAVVAGYWEQAAALLAEAEAESTDRTRQAQFVVAAGERDAAAVAALRDGLASGR
jgi:hypothetical protein